MTMGGGFWADFGKVFGGAFGVGGGLYFARWFITWLTGRHDAREQQLEAKGGAIDKRWASYTKRIEDRCAGLEARVGTLEEALDACHDAKRALEAIVARQEGYATGMGDQRQVQQIQRAEQVVSRSNMIAENGDVGTN